MINERWVVEIAATELQTVPQEQLELASQVKSSDGKQLLIYRENFLAYKVASLIRRRARKGILVNDDGQDYANATRLEGGKLLVLEKSAECNAA